MADITLRRFDCIINRLLPSLMLRGWENFQGDHPKAGDLVILTSAQPSEWALSFYCSTEDDGYHMLESARTGARCRWGNVGFMVINSEKCGLPPSAYWTDEQFAFEDKFRKAWKRGDFHMCVPYIDRFERDTAHLAFRTRYSRDDIKTPVVVSKWQKVTQRDLLRLMKDGEAAHKATQAGRKNGTRD